MTVMIAGVLGAAFGLGLLLVVYGIRGDGSPYGTGGRRTLRRVDDRVRMKAAVAVAAGVGMLAFTGWPVAALLAGLAAWGLPSVLAEGRDLLRQVERTEAVAVWTETLRDTLAAASGLEEALAASVDAAPEQIREEVAELAARLQHEPLTVSLERFADGVADPAADLVVVALSTAARHEARDLVGLLGALAASARAEAEMRRRIHVSRTRIRTSVRVITGTLVVFALGLVVFNRAYLEPYGTAVGQIVLAAVGAMLTVGWLWLRRMARVDTPDRFFGSAATGQGER